MKWAENEPHRVLIAHSAKHFRDLTREMLLLLNIRRMIEAADGAEALERIENEPPDVALIDEQLPLVEGIELTRLVRRSKAGAAKYTPIIILTGAPTRNMVAFARDSGADEMLCKPFSVNMLAQRLVSVLMCRREFIDVPTYVGPCRRRAKANHSYRGPERRIGPSMSFDPRRTVVIDA